MKLYEITKQLQDIDNSYDCIYDEETGEIIPEKEKELNEKASVLISMLENKSEDIVKFIISMDSDIDSVSKEIERLTKFKKSKQKKRDWLINYIATNMNKLGFKSVPTSVGTLSMSKSTSTELDLTKIKKDPKYWSEVIKKEDKFDKKIIKKLIQDGEKIEGAYLKENLKINIK